MVYYNQQHSQVLPWEGTRVWMRLPQLRPAVLNAADIWQCLERVSVVIT